MPSRRPSQFWEIEAEAGVGLPRQLFAVSPAFHLGGRARAGSRPGQPDFLPHRPLLKIKSEEAVPQDNSIINPPLPPPAHCSVAGLVLSTIKGRKSPVLSGWGRRMRS